MHPHSAAEANMDAGRMFARQTSYDRTQESAAAGSIEGTKESTAKRHTP
jgi:hypothetical protein